MLLAIETSQSIGGIALLHGKRLIGEDIFSGRGSYSRLLSLKIKRLLSQHNVTVNDVSAIGVGLGPGSFTGIRIGLVTAKAIAFALNIPIWGISSLDALALNVLSDISSQLRYDSPTYLIPMADAKKGQIFTAIYEGKDNMLRRITGYMAVIPSAFIGQLRGLHSSGQRNNKYVLFGEGILRYRDLFENELKKIEKDHFCFRLIKSSISPMPYHIGLLTENQRELRPAGDKLLSLEPMYVRPSDAEIKRYALDEKIFVTDETGSQSL